MNKAKKDSQVNMRVRQVLAWLISQGYGHSQRELARIMGYKESSLSQIVNGHVPVSDKFLSRLASVDGNVSIAWLMTGNGEMLLPAREEVEMIPLEDEEQMEFYNTNSKGVRFYKRGDQWLMTVRHVPFAAYGQFANESDRLDPDFDGWTEETYEVDRYARGNYLSFEVKGDSMDTGTRNSFEAGDRVLVRELEREFWRDPIRFRQRPFWVVVFGSSVLLKQIIRQDLQHGTITFHSLNPSPEYADFTLSQNEIRALYYVIKKKPREVDFMISM